MLQSSGFPILSDCQPKLARSRIQKFLVQRLLTPTQDFSQFAAFFIGVWNLAIHLLDSCLNPIFCLCRSHRSKWSEKTHVIDLKSSALASKGVLRSLTVFFVNPYTTKHLAVRILNLCHHLPLDFSSRSLKLSSIHMAFHTNVWTWNRTW